MAKNFSAPYHQVNYQDFFGATEVGITHPQRPSFIRLHDNGDLELTAADGLSIILHAAQRSITFVADEVKFLTKEDGFKWNSLQFNKDATKFEQPTFFNTDFSDARSIYHGSHVFLKPVEERNALRDSQEL